jgi:hypothetical protein
VEAAAAATADRLALGRRCETGERGCHFELALVARPDEVEVSDAVVDRAQSIVREYAGRLS